MYETSPFDSAFVDVSIRSFRQAVDRRVNASKLSKLRSENAPPSVRREVLVLSIWTSSSSREEEESTDVIETTLMLDHRLGGGAEGLEPVRRRHRIDGCVAINSGIFILGCR
mmetsp:Transcript_32874/g.57493  ORF Transcript_32874/g.57493 Transcript_32874/m.57493 type:complete len:112 (+) Transcript_32874:1580-1915(+)